jgi:hypothetical protein
MGGKNGNNIEDLSEKSLKTIADMIFVDWTLFPGSVF